MKIIALPRETEETCRIPSEMPQASCLIVGPTGSGKGVLILNMLLRTRFNYLTHYSHIFILSPTLEMDAQWRFLKPPHYAPHKVKCADGIKRLTASIHYFHPEPSWDDVQTILDAQEQTPSEQRQKILLVIDDLASDMTSRAPLPLRKLAMKGRHYKCWYWLTTQLYRAIPRSIRVNVQYIISFSINTNELSTLAQEMAVDSEDKFKELFVKATSTPYSFFCIDMKKSPRDRYLANFEKI